MYAFRKEAVQVTVVGRGRGRKAKETGWQPIVVSCLIAEALIDKIYHLSLRPRSITHVTVRSNSFLTVTFPTS